MDLSVTVATDDGLFEPGRDAERRLAGRRVRCLARDGDARWAVVDDTGVWRASHGDDDWRPVADTGGTRATCVFPRGDDALVGAAGGHLLALRDGALSRIPAFDGVPGRERWYTPWGAPPDTRSLAADPDGVVYVNVHVGGIVRARDLDGPWEPTIDVDADVHEVVFDAGSRTLLAATAVGLASSADAGATWRFETEGLHGSYQRAVAVAGASVLVSASTGPRTDRGAVYRRPIGEPGALTRCERGLPEWFPSNVDTFCLSASGAAAAIGTREGRVYLSDDEGASWRLLAEDLPPVRSVLVTGSP